MKKILFIATLLTLLTGCAKTTTNNNPSDYQSCYNSLLNNSDFHSELYIFPKDIKQKEIISFSYRARDDLFTGSYLLYLVMKYNQDEFNNELNRLNDVKATFSRVNLVKPIIKDEEHSLYLSIYKDNRFEYAIYDNNELEIVYVSNQLFDWKETGIDGKYQIDKVNIPSSLDDGNNTYNMYYAYDNTGGLYVKD